MKYFKPINVQSCFDVENLVHQLSKSMGVSSHDLINASQTCSKRLYSNGLWGASLLGLFTCVVSSVVTKATGSPWFWTSFIGIFPALVFTMASVSITKQPSWFSKLYHKFFHRHANLTTIQSAILNEQWDAPSLNELFDNPQRFALATTDELAKRHRQYEALPDNHPCVNVWKRWLARANPIRQEDLMALDHLEVITAAATRVGQPPVQQSSEQQQKEFRALLSAPVSSEETVNIEVSSSEHELPLSSEDAIVSSKKDVA